MDVMEQEQQPKKSGKEERQHYGPVFVSGQEFKARESLGGTCDRFGNGGDTNIKRPKYS